MSDVRVRAAGHSHEGSVRSNNEDSLLVDPEIAPGHGLFAVFDGVGGHHAGEVASQLARDVVHDQVAAALAGGGTDAGAFMAEAIRAASAAVHQEAKRRRHRRGMGTTAVVALLHNGRRCVLAHVGDSRAYLLRDGRLQQLTRDHTIVAELLEKNAITPEEAVRHPYRNVLSRNLGGQPDARADVQELELVAGDKLLLCSDGLTGYASHEAVQQVLDTGQAPVDIARDLTQLALKGGGGDNVTAVVIEAGEKELPRRTQVVRTSGASSWWAARDVFLAEAGARGIARSPLCAVLSGDEAVDIVAGNLCEAVYRDLEQTTGIHVWTYAEQLASGWLDQGGAFGPLRELLDTLYACAQKTIASVAERDVETAQMLDVAVWRALVVAELAMGGLLAKRMREAEARAVELHARRTWPEVFTEHPTTPVAVPRVDPPPPEVRDCLERAHEAAVQRVHAEPGRGEPTAVVACLQRTHIAAVEHGGQMDGGIAARDLFGSLVSADFTIAPLLDALERAREVHLAAVRGVAEAAPDAQAVALLRVATAHHLLYAATARVVVESGRPVSDELRQLADANAQLRARLQQNEQRIAGLERREGTQPGWAPDAGPEGWS